MPGRTDTPDQAAARHHSTHERRSATHWDSGAYTAVGHVGCGEGCEPVLQHVVVHDEFSLAVGGGVHIGRADGLRWRGLRLQERIRDPVAESQQAGSGHC